jgi:hypothetical protein
MGSTRSNTYSLSSSGSTQPQAKIGYMDRYLSTGGSSPSGFLGMPDPSKSSVAESNYLGQSQQEAEATPRPKSMVGEMRKAGSQLFNDTLGIDTQESKDEEGVKTPGVSTARMAGQILEGFAGDAADVLDPTKVAKEESDTSLYGLGLAPKSQSAGYTKAASPFG